ncbi:MAG TPA: toll/interleukin-1 receptor domain-containing protein [Longimicrobium sp.]|nr:toll/interleukin-1 receptor domain-containing protein [Longimicrobium sp.]
MWDVFISHASEDKETVARPLTQRLMDAGVQVWLDAHTLTLGDSLREKIDEGLAGSRYGVLVLSPSFFAKQWTRKELDGLLAREEAQGKVVLPVWHQVSQADVALRSPILASRLAVSTAQGLDRVVGEVLRVVRPELPAQAPPTVEDLFSHDASVCITAADRLAADDAAVVEQVVDRIRNLNTVTVLAVRTFLARAPALSAPRMVARLRTADRDWQAAVLVPDCMHPAHRPFAENELADEALKGGEPDVVRLTTEALGFVGADSWGFPLLERLEQEGSYMYDKIESYVTLALARMFVLHESTPGWFAVYRGTLERLLDYAGRAARSAAAHGWRSILKGEMYDVLALAPPDRADLLMDHWISSDHPDLRGLAARALGNMRLERTAPALVQLLEDGEPSVRHQAAMALGGIGGEVAVEALAARMHHPDDGDTSRLALAAALQTVGNADRLAELGEALLAAGTSEKCWIYRAMGLSRDARFVPRLRQGLLDRDVTVRAMSALALARVTGNTERPRLDRAHREAGSPMEQIFTALALIVASGHRPDDGLLPGLRETLAIESYMYKRMSTDDIVTELRACESPEARTIAACWQRVYETRPAY